MALEAAFGNLPLCFTDGAMSCASHYNGANAGFGLLTWAYQTKRLRVEPLSSDAVEAIMKGQSKKAVGMLQRMGVDSVGSLTQAWAMLQVDLSRGTDVLQAGSIVRHVPLCSQSY